MDSERSRHKVCLAGVPGRQHCKRCSQQGHTHTHTLKHTQTSTYTIISLTPTSTFPHVWHADTQTQICSYTHMRTHTHSHTVFTQTDTYTHTTHVCTYVPIWTSPSFHYKKCTLLAIFWYQIMECYHVCVWDEACLERKHCFRHAYHNGCRIHLDLIFMPIFSVMLSANLVLETSGNRWTCYLTRGR